MTEEVNCIVTKVLLPFVEKEVGPEGAAAIVREAGHSREWVIADHNWLPLPLADRLAHLAMELAGVTDERAWGQRFAGYSMEWKPTHDERSYLGAYTMGLGSPRALYARVPALYRHLHRSCVVELLEMRRTSARLRFVPPSGLRVPRWLCEYHKGHLERYPTNWGLPRALITETACAVDGAPACEWHVRWRNPPLGGRFWAGALAGTAASTLLTLLTAGGGWGAHAAAAAALPLVVGVASGVAWRERYQRRTAERLRDLQSDEILHANQELEKKFRDLETKIEQLGLLIDLGAAVNATLDVEKIYEQALDRLVHRMGFQGAHLYLVDTQHRQVRRHRGVGHGDDRARAERAEYRLDGDDSVVAQVARTGLPVTVDDVETTAERVDLTTARALGVRSIVSVPLRVKDRVFGVLIVVSSTPGRFAGGDAELVVAVANHVALAVDRAESFQTIEDLSRGLEDKVRVRTEQLQAANEELRSAYRDLQTAQMQLVQREKMASVGQLVAGVAHELNNPIGFVYSNVGTLEDFVRRLRGMLDVYRAAPLPEPERARVQQHWDGLKIDYALKYLDSMVQGIREGAERSRKIVRDLRVFARGHDDVWQAVDLHEELGSSLTLLNHLLKDRVTVDCKFGALPAVECIRSQIDQVFLNLLANAAQAISGEGRITMETRVEAGTAVISITDSGPGIAPEILPRIFDPFFTTKPVGEGTGLGLSISYEIVKKHGGELQATNTAEGGARFTVHLPVTRKATT
jgi:signal transduction histidine kinase